MYFGIIAELHTVVRNNTERFYIPFSWFPPVVISCKTIVQHHTRILIVTQSRYRTFSSAPKNPFCCRFIATPTYLLPLPFFNPIIFSTSSFVISTMLYKWNEIICNFFKVAFFTQHDCPEIHLDCCMYVYQYFYCRIVFYDVPQFI